MTDIFLKRVVQSDKGTFGILIWNDIPLNVTCELPWKDNHSQVSCIPVGSYNCTRWQSPSKGDVFKIHDVPGREDILIHSANLPSQLLGCVAVGQGFFQMEGQPAISNSKATMEFLKSSLPQSFTLHIKDCFVDNLTS